MKKQLLKESEVRKLMKFANIGNLTDGFVDRLMESEMTEADEVTEAEEIAEEEELNEQELDMGAPPEEEEEVPADPAADIGAEDAPAEEPAMDAEPPADGGEVPVEEAVQTFVKDIDAFISAVTGLPEGTVTSTTAPEEGAMDSDAAPETTPDAAAPVDLDADDGEDVTRQDEGVHEDDLEEDMVNEVARRVARRLRSLKRK